METTPSEARLFVALDLPAEAREALVEWRAQAFAGHDDVRLVTPEGLHVTLVFLGHLPEAEIDRVGELVTGAVPRIETPLLTAIGMKPIPPRGSPRLFALDLEDDGDRAGEVQAAQSDALASAGLHEPERRPFWPHVTLARTRKGARVKRFDAPEPPSEPWRAAAVTLYRSRLSREGARYEALVTVPFR